MSGMHVSPLVSRLALHVRDTKGDTCKTFGITYVHVMHVLHMPCTYGAGHVQHVTPKVTQSMRRLFGTEVEGQSL